MEPLDLSVRPPRRPHDRLDGLMMLPRTIDKMRALLPGGNPGAYKIEGFSTTLCELIGVSPDELQAEVARASSEAEVAQWLREHADVSKYATANEYFTNRSVHDVKPENRERFQKNYPHQRDAGSDKMIDIVAHDDEVSFASG